MRNRALIAVTVCTLALAGCGEKAGQPETETTNSEQTASETSTASATTTGSMGGAVSNMSEDDKEFVSKAGMGGLAEVQMGNLALQKASNAGVKAFAQRMVTDHSKANTELQQLASTKGLALPTELAGDYKDAYDHLSTITGADFDKAYMKHMLEDHEKAVADFDKASTSASDADVKGWAGKTLPTLKEHQEQAKTTAKKV